MIFASLLAFYMAETLVLPAAIHSSQVETGMTIRVHQKIKDVTKSGDERERIQVYEGLVIAVGGPGHKTMTVRKIAEGVGVEKIFPLNLPSISKIELVRKAKVTKNDISFVRNNKKRLKDVKDIKLKSIKA